MKKSHIKHIRTYAISAFRLYAEEGSVNKYKKRIWKSALMESGKGKRERLGSPTEAQILRAEQALDDVRATIADLEAVERTIYIFEQMEGAVKKMQTLKMMYLRPEAMERGDFNKRLHDTVIYIPASENEIKKILNLSCEIFAEIRGLRMHEK